MNLEKPINAECCVEFAKWLNKFASGSANKKFTYIVQTMHPEEATTHPKGLKLERFVCYLTNRIEVGANGGEGAGSIYAPVLYALVEDYRGKRLLKILDFDYWERASVDENEGTIEFVSRDEVTDTPVTKTFRTLDYNPKRREGNLAFTLENEDNLKELLGELQVFVEDKTHGSPFVLLTARGSESDSLVGYCFSGFYFKRWKEVGETSPSDETGEWALFGIATDKGADTCIFKEGDIEPVVNIDTLKRELSFKRKNKDGSETVVTLKRVSR